ncbi:hypothetical protein A4A49_56533, partial [Nicotiana attenuata]
LFCKYRKNNGHTIEKCFKLHGYPQNSKPVSRNMRVDANVCSSSDGKLDYCSQNSNSNAPTPQAITMEQYNQLMNILQNVQVMENAQSQSVPAPANFSGISACSIHTGCKCTYLASIQNSDTWILDSGATDHMTSNKSLLSNIVSLPIPYLITLPNGYKVKVSYYGYVVLNSIITLYKVLYVPTFKYNLNSVHRLL